MDMCSQSPNEVEEAWWCYVAEMEVVQGCKSAGLWGRGPISFRLNALCEEQMSDRLLGIVFFCKVAV